MKTFGLLFLILFLNFNLSLSQTKAEIDALLNGISKIENSKHIIKTEHAKKIMALEEKALPTLADFFSDLSRTTVKSDCHERHLTKGEIAIIMADQIDRMPYALLTGVQNCTLEFCKDNSNLIEYYLDWINRDGVSQFKENYISWLSKDWIKGVKGKERRKRKKIIDEWKNASR